MDLDDDEEVEDALSLISTTNLIYEQGRVPTGTERAASRLHPDRLKSSRRWRG
jgi:hypothetical protein